MKFRPTLAPVALVMVLGACATPAAVTTTSTSVPNTPSPSESPSPSATASPPPEVPSPSASPSAEAEPSAGGYGFEDILRVEADGLAVRIAPYTHMPLATGYRDGTNIGDVRLNAGDYVSVELGPLTLGDTTWYRVWPAEGGQLHYSSVWWDTKGDGGNPVEPGWIATDIGTTSHVSLATDSEREPWLDGLPLLLAGTGPFETAPFEGTDYYSVDWVYAIDDQLAPCEFTVEMVSADRSSVEVVSSSTIGAFESGSTRAGRADGTPVVGAELGPLVLRISSGCEWVVRVEGVPHD